MAVEHHPSVRWQGQFIKPIVVGDHLRGSVLGVFQSAISLSVIFSTALGGSLFAVNPRFPFLLATVLLLLLLVPSAQLMRWSNRQAEQPAGAQD